MDKTIDQRIDDYIMENLNENMSIRDVCDNCFISRSLVKKYVDKMEYDSFSSMIKDYLIQRDISEKSGFDKIKAVQDYLFQFMTKEKLDVYTNDELIVFLYVFDDYRLYFNNVYGLVSQCKHKINLIDDLKMANDPLFQVGRRHKFVCTTLGRIAHEDIEPNQLYRVMHFSNKPLYQDYDMVQEVVLKKFHPRYENFNILGTMYILELYS